jgi:hypothetical protein
MKTASRYLLTIWDETGNKKLLAWQSSSPFPRFQKGDLFDAGYFDQTSDSGSAMLVLSSEFLFSADGDSGEIEVSLHVRLISRYNRDCMQKSDI